jgi:hypothetical protein
MNNLKKYRFAAKCGYFGRMIASLVLCLTFLPNTLSAGEAVSASNGETRFIEELYRLEQLPRLPRGESCKMISSYDRTGGNDDGFSGKYSKLREENGDSVLAEMQGPGCIQRMHFAHSEYGKPGLLNLKKEHVRIYLDDEATPALDVPLEDLFYGKLEGFPKPLADCVLGGFYCYVPIPYKKSCKVVVQGTVVRFVQIVYRTFPSETEIVSFRNPPTEPQRKALANAVKAWTSCGDLGPLGADESNRVEKPFTLKGGESLDWVLPAGPRTVRALRLQLDPEAAQNAAGARLRIVWDDAQAPAVDLPLDVFFCQAKRPIPFRSLLAGAGEGGWYNYLPMPYRKSGKITLATEKPLAGTISLATVPLAEKSGEMGYLHVAYHESLPTKTGEFHPYLLREGRGRVVGVYLMTEAIKPSKMPSWLEGDEWFTCDGELRIHGTGTEDSFNAGWYAVPGRLNNPGATPLSGFPAYRKDDERDVAVAYRWYLPDPVSYEKSIDAKLEHGPTNNIKADYRSAVFFYDAAP